MTDSILYGVSREGYSQFILSLGNDFPRPKSQQSRLNIYFLLTITERAEVFLKRKANYFILGLKPSFPHMKLHENECITQRS